MSRSGGYCECCLEGCNARPRKRWFIPGAARKIRRMTTPDGKSKIVNIPAELRWRKPVRVCDKCLHAEGRNRKKPQTS